MNQPYYKANGAIYFKSTDTKYGDILQELPAGYLLVFNLNTPCFTLNFLPGHMVDKIARAKK